MLHPRKLDKFIGRYVARMPREWNAFMNAVSLIGGSVYATIVLVITSLVVLFGDTREALPLLLIAAVLLPLAELIKLLTRRKRPETIYVENMKLKTYSFPSGHSYVSVLTGAHVIALASFFTAGVALWLIGILVSLFAAAVGTSRMYLGAHFPSDVLAGWMLGVSAGVVLFVAS